MSVIELNKENAQDIFSKQGIAVIDFWQPSCQYCMTLKPQLESMSDVYTYNGKVSFYSCNVAEERRIALGKRVMSLPAILFYKNGKEEMRFAGHGITASSIISQIQQMVVGN